MDQDERVELAVSLAREQRLADLGLQRLRGEILVGALIVDPDLAGTGRKNTRATAVLRLPVPKY